MLNFTVHSGAYEWLRAGSAIVFEVTTIVVMMIAPVILSLLLLNQGDQYKHLCPLAATASTKLRVRRLGLFSASSNSNTESRLSTDFPNVEESKEGRTLRDLRDLQLAQSPIRECTFFCTYFYVQS